MTAVLHAAVADMTTTIECFEDPAIPLHNWLAIIGAVGGLGYLYVVKHLGAFKAKKY